jgi:hypothetical protein
MVKQPKENIFLILLGYFDSEQPSTTTPTA